VKVYKFEGIKQRLVELWQSSNTTLLRCDFRALVRWGGK